MATDTEQATKRPWYSQEIAPMVAPDDQVPAELVIFGDGQEQRFVTSILPRGDDVELSPRNRADGELIKRAVNAHDDLVAAVRAARHALGTPQWRTDQLQVGELLNQLDAALKRAGQP